MLYTKAMSSWWKHWWKILLLGLLLILRPQLRWMHALRRLQIVSIHVYKCWSGSWKSHCRWARDNKIRRGWCKLHSLIVVTGVDICMAWNNATHHWYRCHHHWRNNSFIGAHHACSLMDIHELWVTMCLLPKLWALLWGHQPWSTRRQQLWPRNTKLCAIAASSPTPSRASTVSSIGCCCCCHCSRSSYSIGLHLCSLGLLPLSLVCILVSTQSLWVCKTFLAA